MRMCACGCGRDLDAMRLRSGARYATPACRTRAWREGRQRARKASHKRHRRSGLQLSFFRAKRELAAEFAKLGLSYPSARAHAVLRRALSNRQRDALDSRFQITTDPPPYTREPAPVPGLSGLENENVNGRTPNDRGTNVAVDPSPYLVHRSSESSTIFDQEARR